MTLQELLEALKPSQFRSLVADQRTKYEELPEKIFEIHQAIFGDEHRVYYTLDGEKEHFVKGKEEPSTKKPNVTKMDKLIHQINNILAEGGYIVDDINQNKAYKFFDLNTEKGKMIWSKIPEANKSDANQYQVKGHIVYIKKNEFSITKLLGSHPDLQKEYEAYYQRVQNKNKTTEQSMSENPDDYLVVISRHAYDIGGASTDRQWRSCMNLDDGINKRYIRYDIAGGNLISYLINKNDTNIKNPLARVLIKKYKSKRGEHYVLFPEQTCYSEVYSKIIEQYKEVIQSILVKAQEDTFEPDLIYKFIKTKQYLDSQTKEKIFINKEGKTGIAEEDKKILDDVFTKFNNAVKEVVENSLKDIPFQKLIKDSQNDIKEEITEVMNEEYGNEIATEDIRTIGPKVIRLIKSGFRVNDNYWDTNEDIIQFTKYLVKNINEDNTKIEYSQIKKKEKTKDIIIQFHPSDTLKARVVKEFDLPIKMNKDYEDTIGEYVQNLGQDSFGSSFIFDIKKGKLTIVAYPLLMLRIKNPYDDFLKWLQKQNRKIKVVKDTVSTFYKYDVNGLEIKDWEKYFNNRDIVDFLGDEFGVYHDYEVDELVVEFITKKINQGIYDFDSIITLENSKRKPVEEVAKDFYKEVNYDPSKISVNNLIDFVSGAIYELESKASFHPETDKKLLSFFDKMLSGMKAKRENSIYYTNTNEMIKKGLIKKEDIEGSSEDLEKTFYTLYKAFAVSKKAKKKKNVEIKEDLNSIYNKIKRLKAI